MPQQILYMKCDANVEVNKEDIFLKDVASLQCADEQILAKCKCIKVWHFPVSGTHPQKQQSEGIFGKSNIQKRVVISALKLISMVQETCPGVQVEVIGETDVVIEYAAHKKQPAGNQKQEG